VTDGADKGVPVNVMSGRNHSEDEPQKRHVEQNHSQANDMINWVLKPYVLESYRQLAESLKTQQRIMGFMRREISAFIADQQAALERSLASIGEIRTSAQELRGLTQAVEEIVKAIESVPRIQMPSVQVPKGVLDAITLSSRFHELMLGSIAGLSSSYYPAEEKPVPSKASDHPLIKRLKEVAPGPKTWSDYEKLCQDILSFCLVPPLLEPLCEESTEGGLHRRDAIYHIPHDASGFWEYVKRAYNALAVIVEAKNYTGKLPKDQVVITSKYLGSKKLGNFGIIICRDGLDDSGKKEQLDRWLHHDEMIVCLTDGDLEEMVGLKLAGHDPEHVIDRKIRELRSAL